MLIRKSQERGRGQRGWLDSYHSFSFAEYHDPQWMGFGCLRVINEDHIQAGGGFPMHAHQDMEIITYVVHGALSHKDNMGHGAIIRRGDIQKMSAGSGIKHSEFNASDTDTLHLLQIWITPQALGIQPAYEQKKIEPSPNQFILIGSPLATSTSVTIQQQVHMYVAYMSAGATITQPLDHQHAWLQLIHGQIRIQDQVLEAGDAVGLEGEPEITIECLAACELLLFTGL